MTIEIVFNIVIALALIAMFFIGMRLRNSENKYNKRFMQVLGWFVSVGAMILFFLLIAILTAT